MVVSIFSLNEQGLQSTQCQKADSFCLSSEINSYGNFITSGAAKGRDGGAQGPLRNLRNFLLQIAWISSVKYRCCSGRRVLLVVTHQESQLHSGTAATATAWMVYVQWYRAYSLYVRQGSVIAGEFERWKLTVTAADSTAMCDACTPISSFLCSSQLLVTLPLTSATAEHSFSTMRRLNSYLKSTMGESRLHSLTQMSINRDLAIHKKSRGQTGQKGAASELHTLTNLRLSGDGFSLCMPTITA